MIQERKNDMASIIKRKKNYSVVYNYVDENGETKQKWETWHTHKEALKRKAVMGTALQCCIVGCFCVKKNRVYAAVLLYFIAGTVQEQCQQQAAHSFCTVIEGGDVQKIHHEHRNQKQRVKDWVLQGLFKGIA